MSDTPTTGGATPIEPVVHPGPASGSAASSGSKRRLFSGFRQQPLLPEAGAAGAPLTAVLAVISSLAALALAAFVVIANAAADWTAELDASLTVQVKGVDQEEIAARTDIAVDVLRATPGIEDVTVTASPEAAKLLEPWLGKGNADSLNVPALIEIRGSQDLRENLNDLEARLDAASPGLILDDHGDWNRRLTSAARSGQALAFGIFALIMGAASAIAIFAARAGLAANAEIVALLHLVGATDDYIAAQVQRRFFIIGLRGAFVGLLIAIFAIGLLALAARARGATEFFLPSIEFSLDLILPMLIVPLAVCLATAVTARLTVLRSLRRQY
ncbi:MAG: hypothetical protein AAFY84_00170 [Pseudomonadota bacterium]